METERLPIELNPDDGLPFSYSDAAISSWAISNIVGMKIIRPSYTFHWCLTGSGGTSPTFFFSAQKTTSNDFDTGRYKSWSQSHLGCGHLRTCHLSAILFLSTSPRRDPATDTGSQEVQSSSSCNVCKYIRIHGWKRGLQSSPTLGGKNGDGGDGGDGSYYNGYKSKTMSYEMIPRWVLCVRLVNRPFASNGSSFTSMPIFMFSLICMLGICLTRK